MPEIIVRKCPFTGQLFEPQYYCDYVNHLKRVRRQNHDKYARKNARTEWNEYFSEKRNTLISVDEILEWIKDDIHTILRHMWLTEGNSVVRCFRPTSIFEDFVSPDYEITEMRINNKRGISLRYDSKYWCSHDAPIGKPRVGIGLSKEEKKELGDKCYAPAFTFDYIADDNNKWKGNMTDVMDFCAVNLSCGGKASKWYGQMVVFLEDWPAMKEEIEQQKVVDKLKGAK